MNDDNVAEGASLAHAGYCYLCHGTDKAVRPWISRVVTENLGCHFGTETYNRTDPCWSDWHNHDAVPGPAIERAKAPEGQLLLGPLFALAGRNPSMMEVIKAVAAEEGVSLEIPEIERAVATLRSLAEGEVVTPEDADQATRILEVVSRGTLVHVQRIRGPVVY